MAPTVSVGVVLIALLAALGVDATRAGNIGISTSTEPYMVPLQPGVTVTSILTVNDSVPLTSNPSQSYRLVGIPDGMGIYLTPNTPDMQYSRTCRPRVVPDYTRARSRTFTLLLNHEIRKDRGGVRRHGATGAFVSEYIIRRDNLRVVSGEDLIDRVVTYNATTKTFNDPQKGIAFDRFCSADLPAISAFYDASTGKGTRDRIFMNGEETTNGRAFAHVASGAEKGISYELPRLGKGGWENQVACPFSGEKTVVIGLDDTTPGQVYVYVGNKQTTGNAIEKAGLNNGVLYGIRVPDFPVINGKSFEPNASLPMANTAGKYGPFNFELALLNTNGDVSSMPEIETVSDAARVTYWNRPEDGSWQPATGTSGAASFFFVTTASFSARSRLWRIDFRDVRNPQAGGTVSAVVEGSEQEVAGTPKMMDNLAATCDGSVYLQEDPGRQDYLGRIWRYHPKDGLFPLVQHNPKFFSPNAPQPLTRDEESSGIIPADGFVVGRPGNCFIVNTQAHYDIPGELVEGAQLMLMCVADSVIKRAPKQPAIAP